MKVQIQNVVVFSRRKKGISLIEVLIFTLFVSFVLVSLAFYTTFSVLNSRTAQERLIASRLAEELSEWLRGEKESDFGMIVKSIKEDTYCMNEIPSSIEEIGSPEKCKNFSLQNIYKRELTFMSVENTSVKYKIAVYWKDRRNINSLFLTSVISLWE